MINSGYGSRNDFLSVRDPGKVPNLTGSGKESQFLINYLFLFCLDPDQDPGKSSKPNRIRIDNTGKPYWDAWNASTERVGSGLFHEKSSRHISKSGKSHTKIVKFDFENVEHLRSNTRVN